VLDGSRSLDRGVHSFLDKRTNQENHGGKKMTESLLPALKFIELVRSAHSDMINFGRSGRSRFRDAIFFKAESGACRIDQSGTSNQMSNVYKP
jgi:hypothetical protein